MGGGGEELKPERRHGFLHLSKYHDKHPQPKNISYAIGATNMTSTTRCFPVQGMATLISGGCVNYTINLCSENGSRQAMFFYGNANCRGNERTKQLHVTVHIQIKPGAVFMTAEKATRLRPCRHQYGPWDSIHDGEVANLLLINTPDC